MMRLQDYRRALELIDLAGLALAANKPDEVRHQLDDLERLLVEQQTKRPKD